MSAVRKSVNILEKTDFELTQANVPESVMHRMREMGGTCSISYNATLTKHHLISSAH